MHCTLTRADGARIHTLLDGHGSGLDADTADGSMVVSREIAAAISGSVGWYSCIGVSCVGWCAMQESGDW